MIEAVLVLIGMFLGGVAVWLLLRLRYADLHAQVQTKEREIAELRERLSGEAQARAAAEARLEETRKNVDEQRKLLDEAQQKLSEAFKALSADALKATSDQFFEMADRTFRARQESIEGLVQPVRETLDQYRQAYESLLREIEKTQKVAGSLDSALRTPQVRGQWGEMALRRLVELAGMVEHCDFEMQKTVVGDEGRLRPDCIIHLPGGGTLVVDAKVPRDDYLRAVEAPTESEREEALRRHAAAVRKHMMALADKAYWAQFSDTPNYVILFLSHESSLSAALEYDRGLQEEGFRQGVILASPNNLMGFLRSAAFVLQQQRLAENAQRIADEGRELFKRLCKFAEHFGRIEAGLETATRAYNDAVGSWASRLMPQARKMQELGAAATDQALPEVEPVETSLRPLPASSEEPQQDEP